MSLCFSRRHVLLSAVALTATASSAVANEALFPSACAVPNLHFPVAGTLGRTVNRLKSGKLFRILAIGSSSTQGIGASSPAFAYPAQLQSLLTQHFPGRDIRVFNAGQGGETAELTLARLELELDKNTPDLVLWQVGTNDAITPSVTEAAFEGSVERGLKLIERKGCDLIIVDPQFIKQAKDPARYERFVSIVERLARARRHNLFSRYRAMKFWDTARRGGVETLLAKDGLHMNDQGYACVAHLLADHIFETMSAVR